MAKPARFDDNGIRYADVVCNFGDCFAFRFAADFRHQPLDKADEVYHLDGNLPLDSRCLFEIYKRL